MFTRETEGHTLGQMNETPHFRPDILFDRVPQKSRPFIAIDAGLTSRNFLIFEYLPQCLLL